MRVFISYAHEDRSRAEHLVQRLRDLGLEPWSDSGLVAGQAWWDEILARIRAADGVILLISPLYLASKACSLERRYAASLGKHLVPVMVAPVPHHILPSDLASLQACDYAQPSEAAAYAFARAVGMIRPARPLPDPVPSPPPAPLPYVRSYLNALRDQLSRPALSLSEQLEIADVLIGGASAEGNDERRAARELLDVLGCRTDLYQATLFRIKQSGWRG